MKKVEGVLRANSAKSLSILVDNFPPMLMFVSLLQNSPKGSCDFTLEVLRINKNTILYN
jgi:hypothetical protein